MKPSESNPFGEAEARGRKRPQWLGSVAVLGGALLSFLIAVMLLVSLYRNRVASYAPAVREAAEQKAPEASRAREPTTPDEPRAAGEPPDAGKPWEGKQIAPSASASHGPLRLELESLTPLRFPGQQPIFFKAVLRNTGNAAIGFAKVEVRLLSDTGQLVEKHIGYADRHTLFPGTASAVTVLFSKPPAYTRASAHLLPPAAPYGKSRQVSMEISDTRVVRRSVYSLAVSGRVRNSDAVPLTHVRIFAILHGPDAHLVGTGFGAPARKVLAPGETESFSFDIMPTYGEPGRTEFFADGRVSE